MSRFQRATIITLAIIVVIVWGVTVGSLLRIVLSIEERYLAQQSPPDIAPPEAVAPLTLYPTNIPLSPPNLTARSGIGASPRHLQTARVADASALAQATATATRVLTATPVPTATPTPNPSTSISETPSAAGRYLRVNQDRQMMYVYEEGAEIRSIPISSGRPVSNAFTPAWQGVVGNDWGSGAFLRTNLWSDYMWYLFAGPEGSILIHSVPYTRSGDQKIYDRLDALGIEPTSNGCIRISPEDAAWLKVWNPVNVPIEITRWSGKISAP